MTKKLFNKQGAIFIAAGFLLCFSFKAFAEEKEKAARNKNEALYQKQISAYPMLIDEMEIIPKMGEKKKRVIRKKKKIRLGSGVDKKVTELREKYGTLKQENERLETQLNQQKEEDKKLQEELDNMRKEFYKQQESFSKKEEEISEKKNSHRDSSERIKKVTGEEK